MKHIKIISLVLITMTFSSCYFLDYVIPEEYFAEEEPAKIYYIWISHPAVIQCEVRFYNSLEHAKESVGQYGIEVYDSKSNYFIKPTKCGTPTGTSYQLKIKYEDYKRLYGTGWRNLNSGTRF